MKTFLLGSFLGLAISTCARPSAPKEFYQYSVFDESSKVPDGYSEMNIPINWSRRIMMRIDLRFQNMDLFEKHVLDISTPGSALYGHFMSQEEIDNMISPSATSSQAVNKWLASSSLDTDQYWLEKNIFRLNITLQQAQDLFKTDYRVYDDALSSGRQLIRSLKYSLPLVLHEHIALIQPTNMFGLRAMSDSSSAIALNDDQVPPAVNMETTSADDLAKACNGPYRVPSDAQHGLYLATPDCIASYYKYAYYQPSKVQESYLGIANFLGQWPQMHDVFELVNEYYPSEDFGAGSWGIPLQYIRIINNGTVTQYSQDSVPLPDIGRILEANMDAQYGIFASLPIEQVWYSTGGLGEWDQDADVPINDNEPFLEWSTYVSNEQNPPQTISISYGEPEQTVPQLYAQHVASLFAILAAKGISVIVSSGDAGPGWDCTSNDGQTPEFQPMFPATIPFVTAVGATQGIRSDAASLSSGGFSKYFPAPTWQQDTLAWYFGNNSADWQPFNPYINKNGRGFPDVALVGDNFDILANGTHYSVGGTSASAPVFAGMMQRLNEMRHRAGHGRLGFLNPLLYSTDMAATFNDITTGTSYGCTGMTRNGTYTGHIIPGHPGGTGWPARKGWDPVTGLGSPNYLMMANLVAT